jgi:hypothetical protein
MMSGMVWTGGGGFRLAPTLAELLHQLERQNPGPGWIKSPQTGTIGDARHREEGTSDHNPWLNNTVRALDIAANVSGVPGIVTVTDAPDVEALFGMVNEMLAREDPRVSPDGYAILRHRISDPARPGEYKPTTSAQDPHLYHLHISVSTNPAGYNSTAGWPLPAPPTTAKDEFDMATLADLKQALATTGVGLTPATQVDIRRAAARASGPMYVNFAEAPAAIRPAIYQVTDAGLRFIPAREFGEIVARLGGPPYVVTSTTKSIWWRLPIVPGTFDPRK